VVFVNTEGQARDRSHALLATSTRTRLCDRAASRLSSRGAAPQAEDAMNRGSGCARWSSTSSLDLGSTGANPIMLSTSARRRAPHACSSSSARPIIGLDEPSARILIPANRFDVRGSQRRQGQKVADHAQVHERRGQVRRALDVLAPAVPRRDETAEAAFIADRTLCEGQDAAALRRFVEPPPISDVRESIRRHRRLCAKAYEKALQKSADKRTADERVANTIGGRRVRMNVRHHRGGDM